MAIFLPTQAWLITTWDALDDPDSFPGDPVSHALPLLPARAELVVSRAYDARLLEGDPRVRSVEPAWVLPRAALTGLGSDIPDPHQGRYLDGPQGPCLLYTDRENVLGDLARVYEPVGVLLQVRQRGPEASRPLARQVLDGEQGTLAALADSLLAAAPALAGAVRSLLGPELAPARIDASAATAGPPAPSTPALAPEPLRRWKHRGPVGLLAFAPDGRSLATTSVDGSARLLGVDGGELLRSWPLDGAVTSVAFAPGGDLLVAGTSDGDLFGWSLPDGVERFFRHSWLGAFHALAFAPGGVLLASAHHKGALALWDVTAGGADRGQLPGHRGRVWAVAFRPGDGLLCSAAEDGLVRFWDAATREPAGPAQRLSRDQVSSLAWHPSGAWLAAGGLEGGVRLWFGGADGREGGAVAVPAPVHALAMHPAGRVLLAGDAAGHVHLWETSPEAGVVRPLGSFAAHPSALHGLAVSPDGTRLATGGEDGNASLWDLGALLASPGLSADLTA